MDFILYDISFGCGIVSMLLSVQCMVVKSLHQIFYYHNKYWNSMKCREINMGPSIHTIQCRMSNLLPRYPSYRRHWIVIANQQKVLPLAIFRSLNVGFELHHCQ
jgi:hypothetical protein